MEDTPIVDKNEAGAAYSAKKYRAGDLQGAQDDINKTKTVSDNKSYDALTKWQNLSLAAFNGNSAEVKLWLDKGADINGDLSSPTPLMTAAQYSHIKVVKYLIERGANVNAVQKVTGWTALHYSVAAKTSEIDIVKILIDAGADRTLAATDLEVGVPYKYAVICEKNEVADILKNYKTNK